MAYSRDLAKKYADNRDKYRSSDNFLRSLLKKSDIAGKIILDFGCGDGPESERFLKEKAKKVFGVDPSVEMIRLARLRKLKGATFIKNDGKKLPLKDGEIDLVYSRFVLHYIKDLNSRFLQIFRVLKKGGYFVAIFQCLTSNQKFTNKTVPMVLGKGKNITNIKILSKSKSNIEIELKKAGLKIIKFKEVKNTDSSFNKNYKNKYNFKNKTYILQAQKKS